MASIQRLKKDVDYLTFSVVADCISYSVIAEKNEEQISDIIEDVIVKRNELRSRISGGRRIEGKKERKAHYKAIVKDLFVNVDGAFTKLSDTIKK